MHDLESVETCKTARIHNRSFQAQGDAAKVSAKTVLDLAASQVGYKEGFSNGHYNNHNKYAPAVPGLEWAQDQPWCDVFVSWCFYKAGQQLPSGVISASVAASRDAWKKAGRFSQYPAVGAHAIYGADGSQHTGLVYKYDKDYIYTIEGNTNDDGSAEGNGVYRKKRLRRDGYVYGYGYPDYSQPIVSADPSKGGKAEGSV